jgi:putative spermidine/putrescine transport system substrate-binding protein
MRAALFGGLALLAMGAAPAAADGKLVIAAYGGSFETMMREHVIPGFAKANGVSVDYISGNSTDNLARLQAQRGSQQIDVAILDDGPMYQAIALGFCAPIQSKQLAADVYPIAQIEGMKAIGMGFVGTGFGYNRKIFAEKGWAPPKSWMDLADPKYAKKISIPGIDNTYGLHALVMLARLNGGGEKAIDPGFKVMAEKVNPNVLAYESSPGKMSELYQNGEIWWAVWGSGRIKALADSGFPVEYVVPKEGAVALMSAICPVNGGPNAAMAQKFIEYAMAPEQQVTYATDYGYGPTNTKTVLPPEKAKEVIYGIDQVKELVAVDWATINQNRTEWTKRWQREVER